MLIGSHVPPSDPLGTAAAEDADVIQIFLGDPQDWKKPKPREDADQLRASSVPIYVHAPYIVNLASPNNRIRIPSRKVLQQACDAATDIGARRSSSTAATSPRTTTPARASSAGARASTRSRPRCRSYLENTAGGDHAMARHFDTIGRLWDHIGDTGIGFCLDTCHAWAAGEALVDAVERIKGITGRIDLVHCNDSKDEAGSGRDRHANLGTGSIDPDVLVAVVEAAGAPVICETADEGRKDDIAFLKSHVGG